MAYENLSQGGLVGWWKFNEESVQICPDSSGNANHGTLVGSPTWSIPAPRLTFGENAHSISLNGSSQYITAANSSSLAIGANGSITMWIKMGSSYPVVVQYLIEKGRLSGNNTTYYLRFLPPYFSYQISSGTYTSYNDTLSPTIIPLNSWSMITLTWNTSNSFIYINGVLNVTTPMVSDVRSQNSFNLHIGSAQSATSSSFSGQIDDVRIYNRTLSQAEITEIYSGRQGAIDSALIGWWKMDGIQGRAFDSSGFGNSGSYTNSPTITATAPSIGKNNPYAIGFNGSNQYVSIANSSTYKVNGLSAFSVSIWIKLNNANPTNTAWGICSDAPAGDPRANGGWQLYFDNRTVQSCGGSATKRLQFDVANTATNTGGTKYVDNAITDTNWHHVVAVYNNTITGIYIDGVARTLATGVCTAPSGNIRDNSAPLYLGAIAGSNVLNGYIDDVRIYTRALSSTEVTALYTGKY